jgi:HK97 family phage prohead protease
MNKKFLQAKVSIQKDSGKITVVASDETLDRHGEVLSIEQWDLSKFAGSPRMLVDHNHQVEKIVGKWKNARVENGKLLMDADFHDFTPLAKAVKQMVEEGYLDTVSVGFIPHGPKKDGDKGSYELIETSWVTVPANPSARVQAAFKALEGKSLTAEEEAKLKDFVEDADEPIEEEEELEDGHDDEDEDTEDDGVEVVEERILTTIADVKQLPATTEKVLVSYGLITQLIADSEKLQTLIADDKAKVVSARKEKLVREALKTAARNISASLQELNKIST